MYDARSFCGLQERKKKSPVLNPWRDLAERVKVSVQGEALRKYVNSSPLSKKGERLVFVHNPKVAGTSIFFAMYEHRGSSLLPAWKLRAYCARKGIAACLFSVIRDPVDRLYSNFHYLKKHRHQDSPPALTPLIKGVDWEKFVLQDLTRELVFSEPHLFPQSYYLCDRDNRLLVDELLDFSSVGTQFPVFWKRHTGQAMELQKINTRRRSGAAQTPGWQLCRAALDKIQEVYATDYALFSGGKRPVE